MTPLLAELPPARLPYPLRLALLQVRLSGVPGDQGAVKAGRGQAGVVRVPAAVAHNLPVVMQLLHSLAGDDICRMGWKTELEQPWQLHTPARKQPGAEQCVSRLCSSVRQVHISRLSLSRGTFQLKHLLACTYSPVTTSAAACQRLAHALKQQPLAWQQGLRAADKQQQQQPPHNSQRPAS